MTKVLKLMVMYFLFVQFSHAQDVKFGKVSKEELQEEFYAKDSTADAAVLFRDVRISFVYLESVGFVVQQKIHERIKIYNKGGFEHGTVVEALYQGNSGTNETLTGLKATTYNLVNGNVEKTKLKKSDTFKEESSKYYIREKFTMPNLKEGSVIEYQYVINSPFYSSFNEVTLQYDIPIVNQKIEVSIPEYFIFKNISKGYLFYELKKTVKSGNITFTNKTRSGGGQYTPISTSYSSSNLDFKINVSSISMQDVPALKEEVYVNSMENYRSAIKYELQYTDFPNSVIENYSGTWEKVVKNIYENVEFGSQLKLKQYYKTDLEQLLSGKITEKEKAEAIYTYVKSRMSWNGLLGYYTDNGVKKAYKEKSGNVADINLMLVSMLRNAGLKANPVLVSTRSNGVPLFPTRYGFNYVVAVVNLNGANVLLDATSNYSKPNMLPVRTINWAGRIVHENGSSSTIPLQPNYKSLESIMMSVSISENGKSEGKIRRFCKDYVAYKFRVNNSDIGEETYLEKLEEKFNGIEITDYSVKNKEVIGKPVMESISFNKENTSEVIGDKMYLSPLLWFAQKENPFKTEVREYPVDYGYPWVDKHVININIPEGYKVESMPSPLKAVVGDGIGQFIFQIINNNGILQVKSDLSINQSLISSQDYQGLKDFYKAVVEKQTEKVVLSKI